jgi:hypothetical protein
VTHPNTILLHERILAALELLGTATARQLTRYLEGAGWTDEEDELVGRALDELVRQGRVKVRGITYSLPG